VKVRLEATLKGLRRRLGWSQAQLGHQLGVSQQQMSRLERDVRKAQLGLLDRWASELGGYLQAEIRVSGERALTDAAHAALQNATASELRQHGWAVEPEVSFNYYGDRGRIDLLAYHAPRRVLLVVEIKSRVVDVQDVLGRLDVKKRIARTLASERRWQIVVIVPALVVREDRTSRRRVAAHAGLFDGLDVRGRAARAWLRNVQPPYPRGILLFDASHLTPPRTQGRSGHRDSES
jgi:transcriptional regulator with XRE-family HTH domain